MMLPTSERCPDCEALIYIIIYPKIDQVGEYIIVEGKHDGKMHHLGDGCYLERDGTLSICRYDEMTSLPDYQCIHCGWSS